MSGKLTLERTADDEKLNARDFCGALTDAPVVEEKLKSKMLKDKNWHVWLHNDPVNLMEYIVAVLRKLFAYDNETASELMLKAHANGKALIWTGAREKAEFYVAELLKRQISATLQEE